MSTIKDGGPAFPGGERWRTTDLAGCVTSHSRAPFQPGLSLRDYFAAKAMQGWLATYGPSDQHPADRGFCGVVAEQAYALADAMLAAREAQP